MSSKKNFLWLKIFIYNLGVIFSSVTRYSEILLYNNLILNARVQASLAAAQTRQYWFFIEDNFS